MTKLSEAQKVFICQNAMLKSSVIAKFLNVKYDLVNVYREYHQLKSEITYGGFGLPISKFRLGE